MTVNLELSPDREAALRAQAQARGLSIEQWLLELAEHAAISAEREPGVFRHSSSDERPIWDVLLEATKNIPEREFEKLPVDGSLEHDHYLYGHSKRE